MNASGPRDVFAEALALHREKGGKLEVTAKTEVESLPRDNAR